MVRIKKRKASPGKRKLHVRGQVWTYTIGRQNTRIVNPDGSRVYVVSHQRLVTCGGHCLGGEQECVKPSQVMTHIEEGILGEE
jgi:hypothetical protein